MTEDEHKQIVRENRFKAMAAIKDACRAVHQKQRGPGGAVMCICGCGCGGSAACSMLKELVNVVQHVPTKAMPKEWKIYIKELREDCCW